MSYRILFEPAAERQLKKLPLSVQKSLRPTIDNLSTNPRPSGCRKLKGRKDQYRIRSGSYRVIYRIQDAALIVSVVSLGHRKDAYD
ncbi:type II toxin-antitoxin system RelE/ParE family toxin [cf. Phormidesmis sp. LEGE 11477]|uniref:type II toxin-antitoxin system RelE family toxin n=1 Tax=cf. Phormidesmis sp. LEGE 11477 TaxID=1828680 RepID=UPI00187E8A4A|nr:type II toxin-antitoxin system RelE/ParE family toxin [cf. Phormidesmis sp. LEGE 11477]